MSIEELLEPMNMGEDEVKKFLRAAGYTVKDVSNNPAYFKKDIDLIATNPETGKSVSIEVKWDRRIAQTKNFFIEIANLRSNEGKGWFNFCEADFIYYIDALNNYLYIFKFKELEKYINEYGARLEINSTLDGSYGYLLPVAKAPIYKSIQL